MDDLAPAPDAPITVMHSPACRSNEYGPAIGLCRACSDKRGGAEEVMTGASVDLCGKPLIAKKGIWFCNTKSEIRQNR